MTTPATPPPADRQGPSVTPFRFARDLMGFPAKYWWVLLIAGILGWAAAIVVLVWPGRTLLLLTVVAGFWLIFYAAMLLVSAIVGPGEGSDRLLRALLALLSGIAGGLILARPGSGLLAVALAFGIYLIAAGLIAFAAAAAIPEGRGWNIFRGVIDVAAGIVAVVYPNISLLVLATLLWIWLIFTGSFQVVVAFQLRKVNKAVSPS